MIFPSPLNNEMYVTAKMDVLGKTVLPRQYGF